MVLSDQSHVITQQKRLILGLFGIGTNAGLKSVSAGRHGITYKELLHTRHIYMNKYSLRRAIAKVVNATFEIRDPKIWGEGTTACASDSTQIGAWDQNLIAEWHARYKGKGVKLGRAKVSKDIESQIIELRESTKPPMGMLKIAKTLGLGTGTVQRVIKEITDNANE